MEKDKKAGDHQDGQEDQGGVVASRRRRAPGVVLGEEKEATDSEVAPSVAGKQEIKETCSPATDEEADNSQSPDSARKKRASSRTESISEGGVTLHESERTDPVNESVDELTAPVGEQLPSGEKEKEPARRKRRSRRSSGSKASAEESAAAELIGLDAEELSAKSWELFCREVQENGMEIVDDREARKFAVRSVEIARIFLEERARLISSGK